MSELGVSSFSWISQSLYIDFSNFYISRPADLVILRWAYKHAREIGRRIGFYRGDLEIGHPTFAKGSQAVTQQSGTPTEISASKIVYSKEDDDAIDEFHRRTGSYSVNWPFNIYH